MGFWRGAYLIGRFVPVALLDPGGVVSGGEVAQGPSQLPDGGEVLDPGQLTFARSYGPLGDTVAFWRAHQR